MRVFYYQHPHGGHHGIPNTIRTYLVCVNGPDASSLSVIWQQPNTQSWLVPGTFKTEDE